MSSSLWCVTNGRAAAPPYCGCSTGVSTSRKSRSSRKRRIALTARERNHEHVERLAVGDEVEVAPTTALLLVDEAVKLLRQRADALGEQADGVDLQREARRERDYIATPDTSIQSPRSRSSTRRMPRRR